MATSSDCLGPKSRISPRSLDRSLVLVSNRAPLRHWRDETGCLRSEATAGGVSVALSGLIANRSLTWIAGPASAVDNELAANGCEVSIGADGHCLYVDADAQAWRAYYEEFCNPLLWFLQHGMLDRLSITRTAATAREAWLTGYVPINQAFAAAVRRTAEAGSGRQVVMVHDYHLYLLPEMLRRADPSVVVQFYVHIPWPEPAVWGWLPADIVTSILRGLLGSNSIVFQTERDATNFRATCDEYLDEMRSSSPQPWLTWQGRKIDVWNNPISVDPEELWQAVGPSQIDVPIDGMKRILRVDRLDPSKNITLGFQAYARLLTSNPEWRERTVFDAYLVPSREGIAEYDAYVNEVSRLVEEINAEFGTESWQPIRVRFQQNRREALEALRSYDVLLINSIADGVNLVVKEGVLLNERHGAVVLSASAGASQELRAGAITIEPGDLDGTVRALCDALLMTPVERKRRAAVMRKAIDAHQLADWWRLLIHDLQFQADQAAPRQDGMSRPRNGSERDMLEAIALRDTSRRARLTPQERLKLSAAIQESLRTIKIGLVHGQATLSVLETELRLAKNRPVETASPAQRPTEDSGRRQSRERAGMQGRR